jgi:hypothetical protein
MYLQALKPFEHFVQDKPMPWPVILVSPVSVTSNGRLGHEAIWLCNFKCGSDIFKWKFMLGYSLFSSIFNCIL